MMNSDPGRVLRQLLEEEGESLLDNPRRVNAILADYLCGEYRRERHLLVKALEAGVAAELLAQPQGLAVLGPRLTRRLHDYYGISVEAAAWAIESWAAALNVEVLPDPRGGHAVGASDSVDREALVAFYHVADGPNWHNNQNWLSDDPLDAWHGVATDNDGRVTELELYVNGLSGSIPSELGQLSNLTRMNLSHNELSGSIPPELGQLSNLKFLQIWGNRLSGSIPSELGQLSNLKFLGLDDNGLSGSIPSELGQLSNLEHLGLSYNELSGSIPSELGQPSNLQLLVLSYNELSGSIPSELGQLSNLIILSLEDNRLSGSIPTELGQLSNLTYLRLSGNELSGPIPTELGPPLNRGESMGGVKP